jgi:hypothetical protein
MAARKTQEEVVLQLPDMGLSDSEIQGLKKAFQSQLVTRLGAKAAAVRTVIIRIRIVRQA